jgi:hypothetical protein
MYMGVSAGPLGPVRPYKHTGTRRYLIVDSHGYTRRCRRGRYGLQLEPVAIDGWTRTATRAAPLSNTINSLG